MNVPHWKPWFEHCETSYELGLAHGKEDRAGGAEFHYHTGCVMTTDEFTDYKEGYRDGWHSEKSMTEF